MASEASTDEDETNRARGPLPGRVLTADTGEGVLQGKVTVGGACCDALVSLLEDDDVPLVYEGRVREWSLFVFALGDPEQQNWREHLTRQRLFFCPCCGDEFPDSLRTPYFERLRALGIDDPWIQRDQVPAKYKSSRWWREAGHLQFFGTFLDDPRLPFVFSPEVGYGIPRVASVSAEDWWEGADLIVVAHCPWCGRRLEVIADTSDVSGAQGS